jgi:hypothetical protein
MRKAYRLSLEWLSLLAILLASPLMASAAGTPPALALPSGLSMAELKITGDEFIVLQNNTSAPIDDLGTYWLYAYNKTVPTDAGASSTGQQLPVGQLDPGQTLLLSDKPKATCGAQIAGSFSLSLGDSAGYLQLVKQTVTAGVLGTSPVDSVSWSSTKSDVATMNAIRGMPTNTVDPAGMYYRSTATATGWQLADLDAKVACQLNVVTAGASAPVITTGLTTTSTAPPATIISLEASSDSSGDNPTLPASDIGLSAPVINELLPNPTGTGNDATYEFIELYNPNAASFDLSGFMLQTGVTTKHNYTFPADTMLAPQSFTAFYSSTTGLSLSNTSGLAALVDPFGNVLNQSDTYGTAKDGMSWALAKGSWYFTSEPTPNAANVIKQAALAASKSSSKSSSKKTVTTATSKASSTGSGSGTTGSSDANQVAAVTPVHPWTLAVVGALAVAYGIYEYRLDLANRFYQFRKHRAARRGSRFALAGR